MFILAEENWTPEPIKNNQPKEFILIGLFKIEVNS